MFILASSVCESLQCLISALTQGGKGGHLFRTTSSGVLWEGGTLQTQQWLVWGVLAVYGPHWVCPHSRHVCFPSLHCSGSRISAGELSKASPGLRALPRPKPLRFRFLGTPQRHRLSWACVLCPFQVRGAQATRCLVSTLSQVCGASCHLPSPSPSVSWVRHKNAISGVPCVSSGELISDCDPPGGCQPSRIPGRRCQ